MNKTNPETLPTATPTDPLKQPRRFWWEKNYEHRSALHWALNDTHTDAGSNDAGRVTCGQMVLLIDWSKNLPHEFFPKLIVELLNKHFQEEFDKANAPGSGESKVATRDWKTLEGVLRTGKTMYAKTDSFGDGFLVFFNDYSEAANGATLGSAFIKATDAILKRLIDERDKLQARINELNQLIP